MLAIPESDGLAKADSTADGSFPIPDEPISVELRRGDPADVADECELMEVTLGRSLGWGIREGREEGCPVGVGGLVRL